MSNIIIKDDKNPAYRTHSEWDSETGVGRKISTTTFLGFRNNTLRCERNELIHYECLVTVEVLSKPKGVRRDYVTYVHEAIPPELTPEEDEILARYSVFRDSFPPEALGVVSQKTIEELVERPILLDEGENSTTRERVKELEALPAERDEAFGGREVRGDEVEGGGLQDTEWEGAEVKLRLMLIPS